MSTVVDFDAPRTNVIIDPPAESLDLLQARWAEQIDESADPEFADIYDLPGMDIADEDLTAPVIPVQTNEFRCGCCFLVLRRTQRASSRNGHDICRDCA
jgi:hypothetical protein